MTAHFPEDAVTTPSERGATETPKHLRRFAPGQSVRVIDMDSPLYGRTGTVWRVCIGGLHPWKESPDGTVWNIPEAWVKIAAPGLPKDLRVFSDDRRDSIKLRADQCAAVEPPHVV